MNGQEIIKLINRHKFMGDKKSLVSFVMTKVRLERKEVIDAIDKLIDNSFLYKDKNGNIKVSTRSGLLKGKLIGNDKGFAFCAVLGKDDYFIPASKTNGALNGDIVLIRPTNVSDKSTEAEVVEIVEHFNTTMVGTYFSEGSGGIIEPDNKKFSKQLFIKKEHKLDAVDGDKVVVKIDFSKNKSKLNAKIIEVLGQNDSIQTLELGVIREHKLYEEFPEDVILESEKIDDKVTTKDKEGRVDLTNEIIFTIDGEDAKDLDDAISLKVENGNYVLGVHIADVTHYVKENSPIDKEAYLRGTSVYFPNMVLPMLPRSLSNGICSLNGEVERLTLSVEMVIDANGNVISHKIFESFIKSVKRLTYTEVFAVLNGDKAETERLKPLADTFFLMAKLSKILEEKRKRNGALDLDIPENYFVLDEKLEVKEVKKREHNEAHKLIESFMVICNEVVASEFCEKGLPFVYRIHEKPVAEKTQDVKLFMEGLGFNVPQIPKVITPSYYQLLLSAVKDDESVKTTVNKVILRSLQKARYLEECLGHFGLGLVYYCHFTSPIRRYPDLSIHRIIKESLHGKISPAREEKLREFVMDSSERSSLMERNADEAERDVDDLFKAVYMKDKVGQDFEGRISGVTNFGVFVELDNAIEGMIKIENLPKDSYLFFEKSYILKGQSHKFSLGQKLVIKVIASNVFERKVEFGFVKYLNK